MNVPGGQEQRKVELDNLIQDAGGDKRQDSVRLVHGDGLFSLLLDWEVMRKLK